MVLLESSQPVVILSSSEGCGLSWAPCSGGDASKAISSSSARDSRLPDLGEGEEGLLLYGPVSITCKE